MRLPTFLRPAVIALGCVSLAVVPACSSGGDKSSSDGTGGGSQTEYCDAVKTLFDMNAPYVGTVPPVDQQQPLADQAVKTANLAPAAVRDDFLKALTGDTYARDNVDQYNKSKCGIDTGAQRPSTP